MNTSVGMKPQKKQSPLPQAAEAASSKAKRDTRLEQAVLTLESACHRALESRFAADPGDTEALYWQQRIKNIATPISLALAECKGPRHFHYHYRHRADDDSVLHPVLEPPLQTLAQACTQALRVCQSNMVGIRDERILRSCYMIENALRGFLMCYKDSE